LCHALNQTKFALSNTASLPQFQIAAAVATATHGSSGSDKDGRLLRGGLADSVVALEIVGPDGTIRTITKGHPQFTASVVSLGMMGVVTKVTLSLVDDYDIAQRVYGNWPPSPTGTLSLLIDSIPNVLSNCSSFSAFVKWNVDDFGMLILRQQIPRGFSCPQLDPFFAKQPLQTKPIKGFLEGSDFETTSTGRWNDKLHVWMKNGLPFGPQGGPELQMAHFVPLQSAVRALLETRKVASRWGDDVLYCEVRAVRGDDHLLSPYSADTSRSPDSLSISHGMDGRIGQAKVLERAAELEAVLRPFHARPHWAKLSSITPFDIQELYGMKLVMFRDVHTKVDPNRKFTNPYLDRMLLDKSQ